MRYIKAHEKRPRVLEQAITQRAAFDDTLERHGPLKPGDAATSRGRPCTVLEIDYEADTCKLEFNVSGVKLTRSYTLIHAQKDPKFKKSLMWGAAPHPAGAPAPDPSSPQTHPPDLSLHTSLRPLT